MKSYQVEVFALKKGEMVYTCTIFAASTKGAAINKALKLSKSDGCAGQYSMQAFEIKPCRYAADLPF